MSQSFSSWQLPSSEMEIWCANFLPSYFSTGPFFPIADTPLILIPYHHPLTLSIIFRARGEITHLTPQRLSNKSYCKMAQRSPWAGSTNIHTERCKDLQRSWTPRMLQLILPAFCCGTQAVVLHRLFPPIHRAGFGPVKCHTPSCHTLSCYFDIWNIST